MATPVKATATEKSLMPLCRTSRGASKGESHVTGRLGPRRAAITWGGRIEADIR